MAKLKAFFVFMTMLLLFIDITHADSKKKDCVDCGGKISPTVNPDISVAKTLDSNLDSIVATASSHTDATNLTVADESKEYYSDLDDEEFRKFLCSRFCNPNVEILMNTYRATKNAKKRNFYKIMKEVKCRSHSDLRSIEFSPLVYLAERFDLWSLDLLYGKIKNNKEEEALFMKMIQHTTPEAGSLMDVLFKSDTFMKSDRIKKDEFTHYIKQVELLCDYGIEFVKNKNMNCDKYLGELYELEKKF